mmetsp:Transcript_28022/g.80492  ORF Transcript_28022/g.80492 Transcript_28022/m.80492 type:complete len:202 (-) Transcript_28022:53-658(-)
MAAAGRNVAARLLGRWRLPSRLPVELYLTPDIVSSPPGGRCDALVNPANERQVVDGLVHAFGGREMKDNCQALPERGPDGVRCPIGEAAVTPACSDLRAWYGYVVHVAPPMYGDDGWAASLASCYRAALAAASTRQLQVVASPLICAGARGAPVDEAAHVAIEALAASPVAGVVRFGVRSAGVAEVLAAALERAAVVSAPA